ncbi:CD3324 family protein [Paenibacillus glycanilyticus]|uniref:CD3324 family protein n=1 Tax=Paenibacillus glycanilyticus TaxID=126569 RepID=UPI00203AF4D6|nr:CD3324 family protein [Paenibacillus glycanilyticus]MCM3628382.1 CD3324 family protein [Paenibacillus glycanilyticus]
MKYINADVLPEELLKEVQKYVNGALIYVPKAEGARQGWGVISGSRQVIRQRNEEIRQLFSQGAAIDQLTEQFFLARDTIKRIVYTKVK